jgi:hypothetical protein
MGNPKPPNPQGVPKQWGKKPVNPQKVKPNHGRKPVNPGRIDGRNPDACCPMVAAVQSVKRGKFRLARRYAAWSLRLITARMV